MRALAENSRTRHYPGSKPKVGSSFQAAQSQASSSPATPQKKHLRMNQRRGCSSCAALWRHHWSSLWWQEIKSEWNKVSLKLPSSRGSDCCQQSRSGLEVSENKTHIMRDSLGFCRCHIVRRFGERRRDVRKSRTPRESGNKLQKKEARLPHNHPDAKRISSSKEIKPGREEARRHTHLLSHGTERYQEIWLQMSVCNNPAH